LCSGLFCIFPGQALAVSFGMASSVQQAVKKLDGKVSAQQQAATISAAPTSPIVPVLANLPYFDDTANTVMDFHTGATSCSGPTGITADFAASCKASGTPCIDNCDLYFSTGGYFYSNAAVNGSNGLANGWIADVGPVSGVGAIQSYPSRGHETQGLAVSSHGYVMLLGDGSYAALYAISVPAPSSGTTRTDAPVGFSWIYPFQPSSLGQSWLLTVVPAGTSSGTITSVPPGIHCTSNGSGCSARFAQGTLVTLTPQAATGSFVGWNATNATNANFANSNCLSTIGTCYVSVTQDINLIAEFGSIGLAVTAAGTNGGSGTVVSAPAGINCGTTCAETFTTTTTVTLTATPDANSTFVNWSGACAGQGAVCVLLMNDPSFTQITQTQANFTGNQITVTITSDYGGKGNVTSSPSGINCGTLNGAAGTLCQANFPYATKVTLTATPSASIFTGWSGTAGCTGTGACSIMTNGNPFAVTASFHRPTLTVFESSVSGATGTFTSTPSGIACQTGPLGESGNCGTPMPFDPNTPITLTATAFLPGDLITWSNSPTPCNSLAPNSSCVFNIKADSQATAVINRGGVIVTVVNPSLGTITGGGLNCGNGNTTCAVAITPTGAQNITLTATPNPGGPAFKGWTSAVGNWTAVDPTDEATATSDAQIQTITATFQ
jgi:hypothetical protein